MSIQEEKKPAVGLVLSGGGARAAYQAGVLQAMVEILCKRNKASPFRSVTGVSAGAINAAFWAGYAEDVVTGMERLVDLWRNLVTGKVFRTDIPSLSRIGLRWLLDLTLGGLHKRATVRSLLDTKPLQNLLQEVIPFPQFQKNIQNGVLDAIAVTATDYGSANCTTFVQGHDAVPMWQRSRRHSERAVLTVEHIAGSAAIPLFFPPVAIGKRYFGDGCLRNMAPLSPAIHLGSEKLVIVSLRKQQPTADPPPTPDFQPTVARVLSVLLNAVFMDATELDIERLSRVNRTIDIIRQHPQAAGNDLGLRPIEFLWIQPSEDIGRLAKDEAWRLPKVLRYLLEGLGSVEEASEIVSYLLFEPGFCGKLVEMGYRDCMDRKRQIEVFFEV